MSSKTKLKPFHSTRGTLSIKSYGITESADSGSEVEAVSQLLREDVRSYPNLLSRGVPECGGG